MRVYVSGRISGLNEDDVNSKFRKGMNDVIEMGHEAVNPLNNGLPKSASWGEHMVRDIEMLMSCEAIYMLHNWKESRGARIELNIAIEMGFKVIYAAANEHTEYTAIVKAVEKATGLTFAEIIKEGKGIKQYFARLIFAEHAKRRMGLHPKEIAKEMNRTRTLVIRYPSRYETELKTNSRFRTLVEKTESYLNETLN